MEIKEIENAFWILEKLREDLESNYGSGELSAKTKCLLQMAFDVKLKNEEEK